MTASGIKTPWFKKQKAAKEFMRNDFFGGSTGV